MATHLLWRPYAALSPAEIAAARVIPARRREPVAVTEPDPRSVDWAAELRWMVLAALGDREGGSDL